ncbi:GNAT family N-acetyltransferase [Alteromonas gilva]|uniref:GNAT family N-acetyltransferase n=1 Tax=Alteromonas gilva TaxID=2987522 RepID=A0ABT5L5R2_9ALTE|nr:GNAT family N-acetyltransferase [Alteromonas gilva]MDC8832398.1 GNAT family N-acetyltransferase [Alteromonas gilva]
MMDSHERMTDSHHHHGRIRLRRLTRHDIDFILAVTSDAEWLKFIGDRGVNDSVGAQQYISASGDSFADSGYGLWVVETEQVAGDSRIGLCGFIRRPFLAYPDLGYAFLPHGRGQGFATEAVQLVLNWARDTIRCQRVSAICRSDNTASVRLLTRVGFTRIGQLYQPDLPVHELYLHSK